MTARHLGHCTYCARQLTGPRDRSRTAATRDHVLPKCAGGTRKVRSCRQCNNLKGDLHPFVWRWFMDNHPGWWRSFRTAKEVLEACRPTWGAKCRATSDQWAPRPCPADFVEVYLRIGWDGIEDHYRAHKSTIKRWIQESGGDELKERRREVVRRKWKQAPGYARDRAAMPANENDLVPIEVATAAARFLRHPRAGGWVVSQTGLGDWRVGITRKSPAELVEMAERKGFDVAAVNRRSRFE